MSVLSFGKYVSGSFLYGLVESVNDRRSPTRFRVYLVKNLRGRTKLNSCSCVIWSRTLMSKEGRHVFGYTYC